MAVNGLFLCLQLLLWYSSAEQLNEPNFEQDDGNATMNGPVILQDPTLYYLNYKTVYVNCSVYGESLFEVSWLYSTDEISNRSSDYTIISGSKVSNIVYNPNSDDEGYVWWNSSLLLNPINNSTVGYYYCRANTSFGLMYSKPVYVRNTYLPRLNFTRFVKSGQAYASFDSLSSTERKVTFSCLCGECDGIEWRQDNIPLPKSSYGVIALKKELWPYHSINLKHSTLSTSYYDSYLYSCHAVNSQDNIFENSPAYINVPLAKIIESPKASTYIPGETLTQKCSARSLYPMTVRWQKSRKNLFSTIVKTDSLATEGLYNVLNSTISARISFSTPLSFNMRCKFYTRIYFQPNNFTKVHGLYQKGLLFERLIKSRTNIDTPYRRMTIQYPSSITSNVTNITINETERMYLWCSARGAPQPTIIWYHNSTQLHSNSYLTITNPSVQQSAVIIQLTRYERDKGTYTCEARNGVATNLINAKQSHNITVNILVAPEIELPENIAAYENENIIITVKVIRAHPPVLPDHISWTHTTSYGSASLNQSIEEGYDSRVNISENGRSLYISDLTSDDEGYYQVLIWHPAGYKNKTTYLKINTIQVGIQDGEPSTASSATNSNGLIIGIALASGFALMVLCLIVVGVICGKRCKSRTEPMIAFEMETRLRLISTSTNNAEICLNNIDQEVLKNIPYALLMKKTHLKILDCVGQGEFAKVYKGHYYIDSQCITVAVKALKGTLDRYSSESMKELIEESLVMKDLQHPNVMGLIGICLDAGPSPLIVLPYMEGGSLSKYLIKNRESLMACTSTDDDEINQLCSQLLSVCLQIGKGMQYLAGKGLIHRDLAARNCM
uniref:receptor protein-tyrosine kinase n=1 Tax=Amphimedon queenslandica TaxID=400682 RepID=A0A1X7TZ38_AMPQE